MHNQKDIDVSESEGSFCLQIQMKKSQADQESCDTQHLETNLHYKVKPYGKKTRILRAKIDTCSNTNVMSASTYKRIYNDPDCIKLQLSEKKGIQTYTKQKIPVIGSCELFVLHQDDQCFHKVKFQVVSIEGSVIISCATSINLNLIQIPKQLDTNIPDGARLIYSSVDAQSSTNTKYNKVHSEQKILTRSTKKPIGGHKSPCQKVIVDCAVIEHVNLQDATR